MRREIARALRASVRVSVRVLALVLGLALTAAAARATSLQFCDATPVVDARTLDRRLQLAAAARAQLVASGAAMAVVSRSGLALQRWGQRYSHAGLALAAHPQRPWTVRQLYFACDEGRPRLFDQGLAGFVAGLQDTAQGYVSLLLLPAAAATAVSAHALDETRALALLGASYSANAHAFSTRHQNCNQWLIELLAAALGGLPADASPRQAAQQWLLQQGFEPTRFELGAPWWRLAAALVPWLRHDDHPDEDLAALRYRVTMPASIEAFVLQQQPGSSRIELCHNDRQVVVRRGGPPLPQPCRAEAGDDVIALD